MLNESQVARMMQSPTTKVMTFFLYAIWAVSALADPLDVPVEAARIHKHHGGSSKVKIELYMESLCPYCAKYIRNTLSEAFDQELGPRMDLQIVPWVRSSCVLSSPPTHA
jgi:hypothetical protein